MARVQPKYSLWYLLHLANRGIRFRYDAERQVFISYHGCESLFYSERVRFKMGSRWCLLDMSFRFGGDGRSPSRRCGEHLRLWLADPSGDIRGYGARSLHPSCSRARGGRQAGGGGGRHPHRQRSVTHIVSVSSIVCPNLSCP